MAKRTGARTSVARRGDARHIPDTGELIWLTFTPQAGREQAGRRPGLVLSPRSYNAKVGLCLVCPVTQHAKGYVFEVALPDGLPVHGVVLADHVKSADWQERGSEHIATVPAEVLDEVRSQAKAPTGDVMPHCGKSLDDTLAVLGKVKQASRKLGTSGDDALASGRSFGCFRCLAVWL